MTRPRFNNGDLAKVLYSANHKELENKTVKIIRSGSFKCNDFWYDCEYNKIKYELCEKQLWYL